MVKEEMNIGGASKKKKKRGNPKKEAGLIKESRKRKRDYGKRRQKK